ncbi:MAG: hypothetical protein ACD_36C00068G0001 [uncultured bacterium]|nr:MAG: hypothetical protein ACD_36C00068G0001 [uncultured bacterium]
MSFGRIIARAMEMQTATERINPYISARLAVTNFISDFPIKYSVVRTIPKPRITAPVLLISFNFVCFSAFHASIPIAQRTLNAKLTRNIMRVGLLVDQRGILTELRTRLRGLTVIKTKITATTPAKNFTIG